MLKMKRDINQQDFKKMTSILSNLNDFHSFEVVDRVRHNFNWVKIQIE